MGVLEDIFSAARNNPKASIPVTLVTNQPGGEVSYASGYFTYSPGGLVNPRFPIFLPERLVGPTDGLDYLFSDRSSVLQEPSPHPGQPGLGRYNPFSVDRADKLGLTISHSALAYTANFTLLSWGNAHFSVSLSNQNDGVATGLGAGIGANSAGAYYVFSFGNPILPPG